MCCYVCCGSPMLIYRIYFVAVSAFPRIVNMYYLIKIKICGFNPPPRETSAFQKAAYPLPTNHNFSCCNAFSLTKPRRKNMPHYTCMGEMSLPKFKFLVSVLSFGLITVCVVLMSSLHSHWVLFLQCH